MLFEGSICWSKQQAATGNILILLGNYYFASDRFLKLNFELGPNRSRHDSADELLNRHPQVWGIGYRKQIIKVDAEARN